MRLAAAFLLLPLLSPQEIAWKSDWKATLKEAAASKKLVVLVFQSKDRKACLRFEKETLGDPGVQAALAKYLCVRINPEGTDDENKLWQEQGSPMPPMTLIFEPEGKLLCSVTPLNPKVYGPMMANIHPAYFDQILPARSALAKNANDAAAHRSMGEAYLLMDLSTESSKYFAAAVDLMSGNGDKAGALKLLCGQLDQYYEKKWYSPGRGCCSRIADLDPNNTSGKRPLAAWMLGMASCSERRWGEAIDGLKDACERYKESELLSKMMFSLASAYLGAKDFDNAITLYETIVKDFKEKDPETAELSQTMATKTREQRQKAAEGK